MNTQTVKPELKNPEMKAMIARFMKLKEASKVGGLRFLCKDGYWRLPETMPYDTSWDWLMPVIEKISKLNLPDPDGVSEDWQPFPRTFGMTNEDNGSFMFRFNRYGIHEAPQLIDAAYAAVIEFLEGYCQLRKGGGDE